MNELPIVVVDRQTWLRGEGPIESYLLRSSDGKMCCLGSVCVAAGLSPSVFSGIQCIRDLNNQLVGMFPRLNRYPEDLYQSNDSPLLSDDEREIRLNQNAVKYGFQFQFIN